MTTPTSPQALARALLLAAEKATGGQWLFEPTGEGMADMRVYAQPGEYRHRITIANVHPQVNDADARFIALANPPNLTALVTWALETEARNAELAQALLGMQQAAGLALEALPADQQDGTVGTFLATIHRHCASALSLGHGGDFEASAIAGKQS